MYPKEITPSEIRLCYLTGQAFHYLTGQAKNDKKVLYLVLTNTDYLLRNNADFLPRIKGVGRLRLFLAVIVVLSIIVIEERKLIMAKKTDRGK
jgi:hypothetical protein